MVHALDLRRTLRAVLDPDPTPEPLPGDRLAAVLAPLILTPDPSLVFTVRAASLSRHAGEISFPGGLQDPGESLADTALREAFEEIGLEGSAVEILGALPPVHTSVSGILVVPFVGALDEMPPLTVSDGEIAEVLRYEVDRLAGAETPVTYEREGRPPWQGWSYALDGHTIWGATAWMLHTLLGHLGKEST